MTVIAWDGEVLAADRMMSFDDGTCVEVRKIHMREYDNTIYGIAGDAHYGEALKDWFEKGEDPEKFPSIPENKHAQLLYITANRTVGYIYQTPFPIIIKNKLFSIGIGSTAALAMMELGLDAENAVLMVSKTNIYCGMGVDILRG